MRKISIIIAIMFAVNCKGQVFSAVTVPGWYDNLEKYWWYRYRLVNDFMVIGDECGESIPAQSRDYPHHYGHEGKRMNWGDDATIHLGHYIGTLGTEYRILKDNGWDTRRTEYELYYALKAAKRLDENAESYETDIDANSMCHPQSWTPPFGSFFNNSSSNSLNGYFLRDDIWYDNSISGNDRRRDFVSTNMEHFNRPGGYYHPTNPIGVHSFTVVGTYPNSSTPCPGCSFMPDTKIEQVGKCAEWDLTPGPSSTPRTAQDESHDQLNDMFLGTSIATNLLDNSVTVGGLNLRDEAGFAAYRMVSWLSKPLVVPSLEATFDDIPVHAATLFAPFNWSLKNPTNLRCVASPGSSVGNCFAGAFGPCTYAYSAANAVLYSSGIHVPSLLGPSLTLITEATWPSYFWMFQHLQFSTVTSAPGIRDLTFADAFTTVSGAWQLIVPIFGIPLLVNTSWKTIRNHSMAQHFCSPHFPLIYRINFNKPDIGFCPECHVDMSYLDLLNWAPKCGPFHYFSYNEEGTSGTSTFHTAEWSGPNRLSEWYKRDGYEYPAVTDNCEYNGLDYMMLFNLYSYQKGDYLQYLINPYYTENYTTNYPDGIHGSFSRRLTLNWLEYLSFKNTIESDGFISFRGAHELDALPGFEAKPGCVFEAFIQDYVCAGEEGDYHFARETIEDGEQYIQYSPNSTSFQHRNYDDSTITASATEDSLADIPFTEEQIQSMRDSFDYYMSGITDSVALAYFRTNELFSSAPVSRSLIKKTDIANIGNLSQRVSLAPNPASGSTTLSIVIPVDANVHVLLTDAVGREFNQYIEPYNTEQPPGKHNIAINTENLTPGMYYVRVLIGNQVVVKKLTVL